jgi:hypothetical protein
MMKRICALLPLLVLLSGCARALSHEQAQHIIESNPLIRPADDHVAVVALSASSPTEAIVRATIASETVNLKFRKYDTGWAWEFVETKGGGWIAPDVGVGQIRESNRQRRVVEWVAKNQDAYRKTIEAVDVYSNVIDLPHLINAPFTVAEWLRLRKMFGEMALRLIDDSLHHPKAYAPDAVTPEGIERRRQAALARLATSASDAWGSELLLNFDAGERQAVFLSPGPDKQKGTDDDVMCVAKGRKEIDPDVGLRWTYDKSWRVPEGPMASTRTSGTRPTARAIRLSRNSPSSYSICAGVSTSSAPA